jgi:hypothetical protein
MANDLPIACSLSAADLSARRTQIAELGRDALVDARVDASRAELRFAAGAAVRERVQRLADAERECCPFLTLRVEDAPDAVRLTIDAPEEAALVLEEIVAAFRPRVPR